MGVIEKRSTKAGVTYRVQIRKPGEKAINKTFSKKTVATAWMSKTEADIEREVYREDEQLFSEILRRYIVEIGLVKPFGRSKSHSLSFLKDELGHLKIKDLTSDVLYRWALKRSQSCVPSTVMMDMSYIGVVLSTAEEMWGCKPKFDEYKKAMSTLKKLSVISPSDERDRRISDEEFSEILAHSNTGLPLVDWTFFSLSTSMRVGEVSELLWSDLSSDGKSIIIRQRKHPKKKRDDKVPLLPIAQEIIARQTKEQSDRKDLIGKGVGMAANAAIGIPGLSYALGKLDRFSSLPQLDQQYINQSKYYTGPTVFGDNNSGDSNPTPRIESNIVSVRQSQNEAEEEYTEDDE
jgi:integrase